MASPRPFAAPAPAPGLPGLPRSAQDVPAVFARRFNSGDAEAVQEMYAPDAVFVPRSGAPATTPEAIRRANAGFLGLGLPITVRPRHVHVAGDTALLIVDWELDADGGGPGPVRGTATDVARRGPDGRWRYVIDSPFGGDAPDTTTPGAP
ncbi:YybH family protein [Streptomyces sp. NPDC002446]